MPESVTSAPYLIDPTQFGLNDPKKNRERLEKIKSQARRAIVLPSYQGADLTEYVIGPDESFILSESAEDYGDGIAYLVHLQMTHLKGLDSRSVTQVEVWRKIGGGLPRGLASHVFFSILLKRFQYIVSDQSQTDRGMEFWLDQLATAHGLGHRVGVMVDDEVSWKGRDQTFNIWIRLMKDKAWGRDNIHYDTRLVIGR